MTVIENPLWSDYEAFPMEEPILEEPILEVNDSNYSLFELHLNDLKDNNPFDFYNIDWKCLSAMKGLSLNFIRENFKYFNIYTLITTNNFTEKFLIEILDRLIPFNEQHFNMIFDKAKILKVFKQTNKNILSEHFESRVYEPSKNVYKEFKGSKTLMNVSFENIVNYLKQEHPKEYLELDVKSLSSFRPLSQDFVLTHIHKLDVGMLFTNQKFDLNFIKRLNKIVDVPFNPLFTSHIKLISLDFILELIHFDKTVKNEKNMKKIKKSIITNVLPINFNKSLPVTIDDFYIKLSCTKKTNINPTSYEDWL